VGFGMQWHHLDNMKTVCTSLQADNHTINQFFFAGRMLMGVRT